MAYAAPFSRLRGGKGRHNYQGRGEQADIDKRSCSKSAAISC